MILCVLVKICLIEYKLTVIFIHLFIYFLLSLLFFLIIILFSYYYYYYIFFVSIRFDSATKCQNVEEKYVHKHSKTLFKNSPRLHHRASLFQFFSWWGCMPPDLPPPYCFVTSSIAFRAGPNKNRSDGSVTIMTFLIHLLQRKIFNLQMNRLLVHLVHFDTCIYFCLLFLGTGLTVYSYRYYLYNQLKTLGVLIHNKQTGTD